MGVAPGGLQQCLPGFFTGGAFSGFKNPDGSPDQGGTCIKNLMRRNPVFYIFLYVYYDSIVASVPTEPA
jgi:hypothetical protein